MVPLTQPIFLVGMPGSGKSTLGRPLARLMDRDFVDLDAYITSRYRQSVADIFAREGLEAFRRKEQAMLRELADFYAVVVACGGGAPCYGDNMDLMLAKGVTVWLDADDERLLSRLSRRREHRPMIKGLTDEEIHRYVADTRRQRTPFYSRAHLAHSGQLLETGPDIDATAAALCERLRQYTPPTL